MKNHDLAEIGFKKSPRTFADADLSGRGPDWTRTGLSKAHDSWAMKYFESKYNDDGLWFSYQSEYNLLENLSGHMLVFLPLKKLTSTLKIGNFLEFSVTFLLLTTHPVPLCI